MKKLMYILVYLCACIGIAMGISIAANTPIVFEFWPWMIGVLVILISNDITNWAWKNFWRNNNE